MYRSVVALLPLDYSFRDCWQTGPDRSRGEAYRTLKQKVAASVLKRLDDHLGTGFTDALAAWELSTPLTFERYTYNYQGSFMDWSIEEKDYGHYLRQRTAIPDLYLVGQWVFPGFGVAGVMASGYYLAREILKEEGIDVKADYKRFFAEKEKEAES